MVYCIHVPFFEEFLHPKFTNKADVTHILNYFTYNGHTDLKKKKNLPY